jgi:hypothetical protein
MMTGSIPSGLVNVTDDPDRTLALVLAAMDKRWRITVGFWEVMRDDQRRLIKDAAGREQYVHTVRTLEPFDVDGPTGEEYVTCMDATPRREGRPAIRRFRVDRATDITVHKRSRYRMPNTYFIGRVRSHAAERAGEGWGRVAALTDDALWSLIERASSTDDAIDCATAYADARS